MSDHEDNDTDVDDEDQDPLEQLAALGFHGGKAMDALMQCNGNVQQAADLLTASPSSGVGASSPSDNSNKKKKNNSNNTKKKGGKKGAKAQQDDLPFHERRKIEIQARKEKRMSKQVCHVCGGPHPRKECPGIRDDGRGHSNYHDMHTRKKENKEKHRLEKKQELDNQVLQLGLWTKDVCYYDGFADLHAAFSLQQHKEPHHSGDQNDDSFSESAGSSSLIQLEHWLEEWVHLTAQMGPPPFSLTTTEHRKQQLKLQRARELRKQALEATNNDTALVEAALQHSNPRSELIKLILEGSKTEETALPKRNAAEEWPGYKGAVVPFSVLEEETIKSLQHLQDLPDAFSRIFPLLAIPPAEIAKYMQVAVTKNGHTSKPVPLDIVTLLQMSSDVEHTEAALKKANETLFTKTKKKGRDTAEAEIGRLRKLLKLQNARIVDSQDLLKAATQSNLSPTVNEKLQHAVAEQNNNVKGISCGLDYSTAEAMHETLGPAVREAQRVACEYAIETAVKAALPIVVECQDAVINNDSADEESSSSSTASSDLVRILVKVAPPDTTILLRCGSLITSAKPGLINLFNVWPKLYVGLSSSITYSKCPKELLDVAFEVPMERLILTSEAPTSLPAALGGSSLTPICLPPHVAFAAEQISRIKTNNLDPKQVLEMATKNICTALDIPAPPPQATESS